MPTSSKWSGESRRRKTGWLGPTLFATTQLGDEIHISPLVRVRARHSAIRTASLSVEPGKSLIPSCEAGRSLETTALSMLGSLSQGRSVPYRGLVAPTFQEPSLPEVRRNESDGEPAHPTRSRAKTGATIFGSLLITSAPTLVGSLPAHRPLSVSCLPSLENQFGHYCPDKYERERRLCTFYPYKQH